MHMQACTGMMISLYASATFFFFFGNACTRVVQMFAPSSVLYAFVWCKGWLVIEVDHARSPQGNNNTAASARGPMHAEHGNTVVASECS